MSDCIFCKIANHEMPKEFTYEDSEVMVFPDINPVKPLHFLVVPKKHVSDLLELTDDGLRNKILDTVGKIAKDQGLDGKGFRVVVNGGGAQVIDHLHFHLMGPMGMKAGWGA